jgi:hypothetical protein
VEGADHRLRREERHLRVIGDGPGRPVAGDQAGDTPGAEALANGVQRQELDRRAQRVADRAAEEAAEEGGGGAPDHVPVLCRAFRKLQSERPIECALLSARAGLSVHDAANANGVWSRRRLNQDNVGDSSDVLLPPNRPINEFSLLPTSSEAREIFPALVCGPAHPVVLLTVGVLRIIRSITCSGLALSLEHCVPAAHHPSISIKS